MTQEENTSTNSVNLGISGKTLIHHFSDPINQQHHITIGLPQLDNADRHVKLTQYDSVGNVVSEIDMTKYKSIQIVEICEQPTTRRQREDIKLEHALSRNQERLSDFYQSYKNEGSNIDWSKIATKITLPNTSGVFYDHDDKYTVGFRIELSPQGVEGIEFKDDETGEAITRLSTSHTMNIGNLCKIGADISSTQATFCSPTTLRSEIQYSGAPDTMFYLCQKCGVLYDNTNGSGKCFANVSHSPTNSKITSLPYKFLLPYITKPTTGWPYISPNANSPLADAGCGQICTVCSMIVYNNNGSCPNGDKHNCAALSGIETAYWIYTRNIADSPSFSPTIPLLYQNSLSSPSPIWNACKNCNGLYLSRGNYWNNNIGNRCKSGNHKANSTPFSLMLKSNIAITLFSSPNLYLASGTSPNYDTVILQNSNSPSDTWWKLGQPDSTQGDYTLKCLGTPKNPTFLYLGYSPNSTNSPTPKLVATLQEWQIVKAGNSYNIKFTSNGTTYFLTISGTQQAPTGTRLTTSPPSPGMWQISVME